MAIIECPYGEEIKITASDHAMIHLHCDGFVHINKITINKSVLYCPRCGMRYLLPEGCETKIDLLNLVQKDENSQLLLNSAKTKGRELDL
jgi:hypothetical protein